MKKEFTVLVRMKAGLAVSIPFLGHDQENDESNHPRREEDSALAEKNNAIFQISHRIRFRTQDDSKEKDT